MKSKGVTKADVDGASYEPENVPAFSAASGKVTDWKGDLLALGLFEEDFKTPDDTSDGEKGGGEGATAVESAAFKAIDEQLAGGALAEAAAVAEFKGKKGSSTSVRLAGALKCIALLGLGKRSALESSGSDAKKQPAVKWGPSVFKAAGMALGDVTAAAKCTKAMFAIGSEFGGSMDAKDLAFGLIAAPGPSQRFKSERKPPKLQEVQLLSDQLPDSGAKLKASVAEGASLARANLFARYLVESPPNVCSPTYLAGAARSIADQFESMTLKVLEQEECEKLGMGCYLGVAMGSDTPPKFIHLTYTPPGEVKTKLAIVGKGVTFDTGGYNIKAGPGSLIEKMKFDMGGSAAVFGAARGIAELAPKHVEVHFISAACENMINGKALRPGDVLVSASGKTVEIGNTDAEGRLTLCDALWYAQEKVGATKCIDIATLTGAQLVALGMGIGAVMGPEDGPVEALRRAGGEVGEKWWQLPLEDEYFELLKSKCADFNNIGGRWAGSITAGLFLKQFVDSEKMEWAHCDMAGPVWSDAAGCPTGFGAVTLASWVTQQSIAAGSQ